MKKNTIFYLLTLFFTLFFTYGLLVIGDYFYHLHQYSEMRITNDILTACCVNEFNWIIFDQIIFELFWLCNTLLLHFLQCLCVQANDPCCQMIEHACDLGGVHESGGAIVDICESECQNTFWQKASEGGQKGC